MSAQVAEATWVVVAQSYDHKAHLVWGGAREGQMAFPVCKSAVRAGVVAGLGAWDDSGARSQCVRCGKAPKYMAWRAAQTATR